MRILTKTESNLVELLAPNQGGLLFLDSEAVAVKIKWKL